MRNLRKLFAVVIAVALVLTSMTTAFAASTTYDFEAEANVIKDLGIWTGNDAGDLMLGKDLTRAEGAVIVLKAVYGKTDADAEKAKANTDVYASFDDAAKVPAWAEGWMALAVEAGVVKGSKNNLNAGEALLGKDLASMFMNSLGYADENEYGKAVELLAEKSASDFVDFYIDDLTNAELTRDAAAAIVFDAFTATAKDASKTLIEAIVGDNAALKAIAVKAGLILAPAEMKVTGITANNLHTMKIDFTKAVDADSVTADTLKVVNSSGDSIVANREVTDDNMSVVVVYNGTIAQSAKHTVKIDGIKSTDGLEIKGFEETKVVNDVTPPEITGAIAHNAKQIEISASEPMQNSYTAGYQVISNIKLDGAAIIAKIEADDTRNTLVVSFPSPIKAGNHTLAITGFKDYASYVAVDKEFTVTLAEDTTAPSIIAAEVKNIKTIEVTFDEMVDSIAIGSFKVDGKAASPTVVPNSKGTKYSLTGFGDLDLKATVEVKIAYKDQADAMGNKVSTEKVFTFNIKDDTTLPTVSATIESGNKITLTFSKSMLTDLGTIVIKDKDGKQIGSTIKVASSLFKNKTNNTVIEITSLPEMDAQELNVIIKDMKDATIRANLLPEASIKLAGVDTKKPDVDSEYFVKEAADTSADDTITFYFSEAMDNATLTNLSNYVVNGISLAATKDVSVSSVSADGKTIVIKYKNARDLAKDGNGAIVKTKDIFTVYAVKDLAGNMVNTNNSITRKNPSDWTVIGAETSDGIKVKISFNTILSSIDPSMFKIYDTEKSSDKEVFVNAVLASDGKSAEFTAQNNLGTYTDKYEVRLTNSTAVIKDIYGKQLVFSGKKITDKVKPTVEVAAATTVGAIEITFSETVTVAAIDLAKDLVIKDADGVVLNNAAITFVSASGAVVSDPSAGFTKIVFTGNKGEEYTIQLFGRYVKDVFGNVINELPSTKVTTKAE